MEEYKYYDGELGIDGTAIELFKQVRNGYYDTNIPAMKKIADIIATDRVVREIDSEKSLDNHLSRYVLANIKLQEEYNKDKSNDLSIAFYKLLMDIEGYKVHPASNLYNIGLEEQESNYTAEDGSNVYTAVNGMYDRNDDKVVFSIMEIHGDSERENAAGWTYDEIKDWNGDDFNRAINEMLFYANEIELDQDDKEM